MPLNIKNPHVEKLATEVARLAGETKTEAIKKRCWSAGRACRLLLEDRVEKHNSSPSWNVACGRRFPAGYWVAGLAADKKTPFSATARKVTDHGSRYLGDRRH